MGESDKCAPDHVNVTYAHERTHAIIQARERAPKGTDPTALGEENNDFDQDGILNGEEIEARMDPRKPDSFGLSFRVSAESKAPRDVEFYCVLGGALSPFGRLTKPASIPNYAGRSPEEANEYNDWSKGGVQWQKD